MTYKTHRVYRWRCIRTSLAWWLELAELPTAGHRTWPLRLEPFFSCNSDLPALLVHWGNRIGCVLLGRLKVLILGVSPCVGIAGWEEEGGGGMGRSVACRRGDSGWWVQSSQIWSRPPQAPPGSISHCSPWQEDSLFCSFVALKIILSIGHFTLAHWHV